MSLVTGDPLRKGWYLERLGRWPLLKPLAEGVTVIGRAAFSDVHVVSLFASRKHCTITRQSDSLQLQDLDSFNGTFVNGQVFKNASCELKLGDVLAIGGQMDMDDADLRQDAFVFRLRNEQKELDDKDDTIDYNEPLEQFFAQNLPQVYVKEEANEPEECNDDHEYCLHILSQMADDVQEIHTSQADDEPSDFPAEPPKSFSPEIIDLISDDEEDLNDNVDQWLSRLSQSQHKEVLIKTDRSRKDEEDMLLKDAVVMISPLKMKTSRPMESTEELESEDDEIIMIPAKKRKSNVIVSDESREGENDVLMDIVQEEEPVKIKPPQITEIREADQSDSTKERDNRRKSERAKVGEPEKRHRRSKRGRKDKETKLEEKKETKVEEKKKTKVEEKKETKVEKPKKEEKSAVQSREELTTKRLSVMRKLPVVIEAPAKPKKRAHLRGFCASEMGKTPKKVSIDTVKGSAKSATVPEIVRRKEIKEIRKEKLKEVSLAKTGNSMKTTTVNAPMKVKVTSENRGNFLTEPLPKAQIPSRRKSFDATMEALQQTHKMPARITLRRKSVAHTSNLEESQLTGVSNVWECIPPIPTFTETSRNKRRIAHNEIAKEKEPEVIRIFEPPVELIEPQRTTKISFGEPLVEIRELCPTPTPEDDEPELLCLTLDGVINEVTKWSPDWLTNRDMDISSLINPSKPLMKVKEVFGSFSSYVNTMVPLMLLDLWAILVNETFVESNRENILVQFQSMVVEEKATIVKAILVSPAKCSLRVGDLVVAVYQSPQRLQKSFMYVRQIDMMMPKIEMTFETSVNDLKQEHESRVLIKIEKIASISSQIRVFDSVFNLFKSPLCNMILDPNEFDYYDEYQMRNPFVYRGYDALNDNQLKTVEVVFSQCMNPRGTISLVQGPPGTGKSRVIANLVLQLLLSDELKMLYPDMKILLCAQSNSVVDFMTWKLSTLREMLKPEDRKNINLIRFGVEEKMNYHAKRFSLDELSKRTKKDMIDRRSQEKYRQYIQGRLISLKKELTDLSRSREDCPALREMRLNHTLKKISELERYLNGDDFGNAYIYDKMLVNANVVCTTLSSCSNLPKYGVETFDVCIVDEAAQSNEPVTLAPLQFGVSSLVLVGDPLQLPATVLSMEAKQHGLSQSLFKRLSLSESIPVQFLNEQYRMHPEICKFPNEYFYDNRLLTSPSVVNDKFPWKTYGVFSLDYSCQNQSDSNSISNTTETDFVSALIQVMMTKAPPNQYSYGIITPYSEQKKTLSKKIKSISEQVFISTVDGYQGQEMDVIIISLARTAGVGFLANSQRLNVALTRAKKCLFVCGNFISLKQNEIWSKFIQDAKIRGCFQVISSFNQSILQSFIMK